MNDDSVGTASLPARLPAIPPVPEANQHVNTDFSISKFCKNVHYGSPSVLSRYYHQPGSYVGQDTGYSSDDRSDSEETRLRKRHVTRRKRKKRKRKKKRAGRKKTRSHMVDDQQLIRQNELKEYFSNVYDDTSVAKAADRTKASFAVNLSPIRRVAIRDKIIKSNVQVFPSSQALVPFVAKGGSMSRPLNWN